MTNTCAAYKGHLHYNFETQSGGVTKWNRQENKIQLFFKIQNIFD